MRAELDERVVAVSDQPFDHLAEAHRPAQVVALVAGVEARPVERRSGDRRVERDRAGAGADRRKRVAQLGQERVHLRAV